MSKLPDTGIVGTCVGWFAGLDGLLSGEQLVKTKSSNNRISATMFFFIFSAFLDFLNYTIFSENIRVKFYGFCG